MHTLKSVSRQILEIIIHFVETVNEFKKFKYQDKQGNIKV